MILTTRKMWSWAVIDDCLMHIIYIWYIHYILRAIVCTQSFMGLSELMYESARTIIAIVIFELIFLHKFD